jgi:hypothetical protein
MAQAVYSLTTSENRKLAVLMRMALTFADAAGAEPDAVKAQAQRHPLGSGLVVLISAITCDLCHVW